MPEVDQYKVEIVRTDEGLAKLESDYRRLWCSADGRPFNSFDWTSSWLKALDKPVDLFVVCAYDSKGQLKGIAPYYSSRLSLSPGIPYRVLRPIGDPGSLAEYLGWIVDPDDSEATYAAIARYLASAPGWDLIWMPYLDPRSRGELIAGSLTDNGILVKTKPIDFGGACLPSSIEDFLKEFSSRNRYTIKRDYRRAFEEDGCELTCTCEGEAFAEGLSDLITLHNKRWNATGIEGSFQRSDLRENFLSAMVESGNSPLRIYTLKRKTETLAAQLGAVYANVFYQLQEGFDPDASTRYTLGNVLRLAVLEDLIKSGVEYYDFMGGFTEHKRRWRADPLYGIHLLAVRHSIKNLPFLRTRLWVTGRFVSLDDVA